MYIREYWHELWNTESRSWQVAQRIISILILPALVYYIFKYGTTSPEMEVATVLVPLVVTSVIGFLLFAVFIPYRLWRRVKDDLQEQRTLAVEFYTSRSEFTKSRGGLLEVIEPCREVWMTMWTGSKTWQSEVFKQPNVKRLIIQHPDYELVKTFAKAEKGDLEVYRRNIVATTSNALNSNIPVVWANEAIIGMIIDVEKDKGWARVEYFIPHSVTPDAYPSFIVYESNKNEKELYKRLCASFDDMFSSKINVKVTKEMVAELKRKLGMQANQE